MAKKDLLTVREMAEYLGYGHTQSYALLQPRPEAIPALHLIGRNLRVQHAGVHDTRRQAMRCERRGQTLVVQYWAWRVRLETVHDRDQQPESIRGLHLKKLMSPKVNPLFRYPIRFPESP